MRYTDFENAEQFLRYVLETWIAFCEVNTGLARAIADLLRENAELKEKIATPKDSDPKN